LPRGADSAFPLRISAEDILPGRDNLGAEALNRKPSLTRARRLLTFGAQKGHDDQVFSLGLALWPRSRWADAKSA
jgi:hypothetical protein